MNRTRASGNKDRLASRAEGKAAERRGEVERWRGRGLVRSRAGLDALGCDRDLMHTSGLGCIHHGNQEMILRLSVRLNHDGTVRIFAMQSLDSRAQRLWIDLPSVNPDLTVLCTPSAFLTVLWTT